MRNISFFYLFFVGLRTFHIISEKSVLPKSLSLHSWGHIFFLLWTLYNVPVLLLQCHEFWISVLHGHPEPDVQYRMFVLTIVTNIKTPLMYHMQQFSKMVIQPLCLQSISSKMALTEEYEHTCFSGMKPACTGFFHHTESYCSMGHHLLSMHWYTYYYVTRWPETLKIFSEYLTPSMYIL